MKRLKGILEKLTEGTVTVYDNGGESIDRYTVIIDKDAYGMSDNPDSPQGFNQYIGMVGVDVKLGNHLGKKLSTVPSGLKKAIQARK